MADRSGFEGVYRPAASPKRRREVLDRIAWGMGPKQIAADLGISRSALSQVVEALRSDGQLPAGPAAGTGA